MKLDVLIYSRCSRFTIIERRSLKSAPLSILNPENSDNAALPDLDTLDHDLTDLPDVENNQFSTSFSLPSPGLDSGACNDNMDAYSFGNLINNPSSHQLHQENGSSSPCHMDTATSHATLSRRQSQIDALTASSNIPNSCLLLRLGSEVPSLISSNITSKSNGNSASNSFSITPPCTPETAGRSWNAILHPTNSNIYNAGYPISSSHPNPSPICPPLTQIHPRNAQTASLKRSRSTTAAVVEANTTGPDWPQLSPTRSSGGESVGEEGGDGGGGTSIKGNRTTTTLEDAEPGVILDVMKVLVNSKGRVKYETD